MNKKICIVGLGYVGLPLAHAFSEKYQVVGFDINKPRVDELNSGFDRTLELTSDEVNESIKNGMIYSTNIDDIKDCNIYIVTVPTPIEAINEIGLFFTKTLYIKYATYIINKSPIIAPCNQHI